jgi:6-phosphogluconolactonase
MNPDVRIFTSADIMADSLAEEFYRHVIKEFATRSKLNFALSGGNTPMLFFEMLSNFNNQKKNKIDWKNLNFFWGDERCVPPDSDESNYGNAEKVLFSQIDIPRENVHRINGENKPEDEVKRYSELILKHVPSKNGIPIFDWVFLGVGDDGHTASIFPNQMHLLTSDKICEIAEHPESGQKRITLTGTTINMAKRITFMASGESKQEVLSSILNREGSSKKYPASKIAPQHGKMDWYLDAASAEKI